MSLVVRWASSSVVIIIWISLWSKAFLTKVYYFVFSAIVGEEGSECASAKFIYSVGQGNRSVIGE